MVRYKALDGLRKAWLQVIRRNVVQNSENVDQFAKISAKEYGNKMREIHRRHDCSPLQTIIYPFIVQTPLFFLVSFTLRGMAGLSLPILGESSISLEPEFAYEGALWFENLLLPDPTFLLPFGIGSLNFLNAELTSSSRGNKTRRFNRIVTNNLKILSVITIPIAMQLPSVQTLSRRNKTDDVRR
ncbi:Mitochondrial inner membrane protein COX18 [Neolecta irregularis DAH-3]|uniref:Mitochondrial inner membrane protein COX18 n=1 Tax=Neolecta irregularis (strain DAH-3) TaxID=1198029 RepID=A0A1U7LHI1_NEOID|nr:Mitochondrial inner membrane protein COX18 [Neolecta irregularis DAH-3]|eukprot:OLL22116.1 Mitochondrial inner membrane protein COX18 [Neolecta irregularis DAH-3]